MFFETNIDADQAGVDVGRSLREIWQDLNGKKISRLANLARLQIKHHKEYNLSDDASTECACPEVQRDLSNRNSTILLSNFATLSPCATSRDGHFKFKNLQWMSIKTQIFFELNKIILLVNSIPREWRKNVPKNGLHVNIVDENVHGYYANEEWQSHIRCREERADSRLAIV